MSEIVSKLKSRFQKNMHRHQDVKWDDVEVKLDNRTIKVIEEMEKFGGEPDVISYKNQLYIVDFSKETPKPRTSVCYDEEARLARKKFPPETSALALCKTIGFNLMDEELYRYMQSLEPVDLKTSSWLSTPDDIRALGGALFGDNRYQKTFVYHNGADSYYSARGFRGYIILH